MRYFERNYDVVAGALDRLVADVVGNGIFAEPQVLDIEGNLCDEVNEQIIEIQKDWRKRPEVTRSYDEFESQRLKARTLFRDGDYFCQLLPGNIPLLRHSTDLPFSYENLEPDFCPYHFTDPSRRIFNGIELNRWRQPRAIWVYLEAPNSNHRAISTSDLKRIPIERVIHGKTAMRIGQTRGITHFASTLTRLHDIKDYEESERIAARISAAVFGSIKRGPQAVFNGDATPKQYSFMPGTVINDLPSDTEFVLHSANRPNAQLDRYLDQMQSSASAGARISHSAFSKQYEGSYSSRRQEAVEQYQITGMLWGYFVSIDQIPIHETSVNMALLSGLLDIPSNCDLSTLFDAEYSRPALPQINPRDEVSAIVDEIDAGILSRSQAIRSRSRSPYATKKQIKQEQEERQQTEQPQEDENLLS